MELKGKKIAFLGDSITQGCGVANAENIYWQQIGKLTGAQVYGYGIGGTRIAKQHVPSIYTDIDDKYFSARVGDMIPDADVVVVFGGTNDFGHGDAPLGAMSDRTEDTFYGACHVLMEKLIRRYPDGKLVVMTPLRRYRPGEDDGLFNSIGIRQVGTLETYVGILRQVAGYYGAVVVDLFTICPIQPKLPEHQARYMPDGLHPNDTGHALIAACLLKALQDL